MVSRPSTMSATQKTHRGKWSAARTKIPKQWLLDLRQSTTNKQLTIPQVESFKPWENPHTKITLTLHKTPNRASRSVLVKCPWPSAGDTLQHPGFCRFRAPSRGRSPPKIRPPPAPRGGLGHRNSGNKQLGGQQTEDHILAHIFLERSK